MTVAAPPRDDATRVLVGIPTSLLANLAAVFAVVQSPYGSLGFFDDSPTASDWALPMAVGAVIGVLQGLAFTTRAPLFAGAVTLMLGLMSFIYIYPVVNCVIGAAAGTLAAALARRWLRVPRGRLAAGVLLGLAAASSAVYGLVDHTPEPQPAVTVLRSLDGPAVLVDVAQRLPAASVTGTLADVDGCLGLVNASMGDGTLLLLLPEGSGVSSMPFTVTVNGNGYGLGDKITVTGGGLLTRKIDLDAYRPDLPASCSGRDLFV